MISIRNVCKRYDDIPAVDDVSLTIEEGSFYGMIGTNGAGKSTLLRMMAGTLRADSGSITIDEKEVYDNPTAKDLLFFIPDEPYFFRNSTPAEMAEYYASIYKGFDRQLFARRMKDFELDENRRIRTYSKGMKKQLSILLGIASGRKYLLMDETFDGLDPAMRQAVKSLFAREMIDHGMTPVLSSHNLRELEDICDHVGLLHRGGVLLSKDIENMKLEIQKLQVVFEDAAEQEKLEGMLTIVTHENRGRLHTYTVRGTKEETEKCIMQVHTVFSELLNLTLEEIFISETEVKGYEIKKILLG